MASDGAEPSCHAPFASLYLDPRGFARVCALNNGAPLGNVARVSVLDIWQGARAQSLRQAFRGGCWGDGCEVCAWQASSPGPDHSFARTFDQFGVGRSEPTWPRRIEFALGNTCNLRCVMCSGDLSSAIRSRREGFEPLPDVYGDGFFEDLAVLGPHLEEARFLGGEPFLVRAHHRAWEVLEQCAPRPSVHVTTNGMVWNERVEQVLDRFDTSVALSVDGVTRETVEQVRAGADFDVLMQNLHRFVDYTRERGTHFGLTFCLMSTNWEEFGEFLAFGDSLDVDVFVNLVTMPSELSLIQLPAARLQVVVDGLKASHGTDGDGIGRNRTAWQEQLAQLEARLASPAGGVRIRWWQTVASRLTMAESMPSIEADRAELDAWSGGGPTAVLELDGDDRVLAARPADRFLDLPVAAAGRVFDDLVVLVSSFYGRRSDHGWVRHRGDLEDRTARYETADTVTDLRSISRLTAPDRVRMAITARQRPFGQGVVIRSSAESGATTPSQGSIRRPADGAVPNSSVV